MFNSLVMLLVLCAALIAFVVYGVVIKSRWTLALAVALLVIALLACLSILMAAGMPQPVIPA